MAEIIRSVLETRNWASVEEVVQKTIAYGNIRAIQPQLLEDFDADRDGLYAVQVGTHGFGMLHLSNGDTCIIADGLNTYGSDPVAQEVLSTLCGGKKIITVPFLGQNQDNRCASSVAAILIEFQKVHRSRKIPTELRPEKFAYYNITKTLHPVETAKLTSWQPISEQSRGVTCPDCGRNWPSAKNRSAHGPRFTLATACKLIIRHSFYLWKVALPIVD